METFSALLAICAGNSPVPGEFPAQRPVTRSFDVYFDLCLNKRLKKQWWGWWFETLSRPLWRHRNELGKKDRGNILPKLKLYSNRTKSSSSITVWWIIQSLWNSTQNMTKLENAWTIRRDSLHLSSILFSFSNTERQKQTTPYPKQLGLRWLMGTYIDLHYVCIYIYICICLKISEQIRLIFLTECKNVYILLYHDQRTQGFAP